MSAFAPSAAGLERSAASYLRDINKFPILEPEAEATLSRRWRKQGDVAAMHKLVTSHLRLVIKLAVGYRGYGLPIDELIAQGNVGMMRAVKRFDPDRGFRLSTYAIWWIRAAMQEYILCNWSLVKMGTTAAQKKLFFNLRRLKRQLRAIDEGDLPVETVMRIAATLRVAEADVVSMNRRLATPDQSLNEPLREDGDGERQDRLLDPSDSQETRLADHDEYEKRRKLLWRALQSLMPREQHIVRERWLREKPASLAELGELHRISQERVRQIEARALGKLQIEVQRTSGLTYREASLREALQRDQHSMWQPERSLSLV